MPAIHGCELRSRKLEVWGCFFSLAGSYTNLAQNNEVVTDKWKHLRKKWFMLMSLSSCKNDIYINWELMVKCEFCTEQTQASQQAPHPAKLNPFLNYFPLRNLLVPQSIQRIMMIINESNLNKVIFPGMFILQMSCCQTFSSWSQYTVELHGSSYPIQYQNKMIIPCTQT